VRVGGVCAAVAGDGGSGGDGAGPGEAGGGVGGAGGGVRAVPGCERYVGFSAQDVCAACGDEET
jgi:hypothetical protein